MILALAVVLPEVDPEILLLSFFDIAAVTVDDPEAVPLIGMFRRMAAETVDPVLIVPEASA
jgi:hypothetical protein